MRGRRPPPPTPLAPGTHRHRRHGVPSRQPSGDARRRQRRRPRRPETGENSGVGEVRPAGGRQRRERRGGGGRATAGKGGGSPSDHVVSRAGRVEDLTYAAAAEGLRHFVVVGGGVVRRRRPEGRIAARRSAAGDAAPVRVGGPGRVAQPAGGHSCKQKKFVKI